MHAPSSNTTWLVNRGTQTKPARLHLPIQFMCVPVWCWNSKQLWCWWVGLLVVASVLYTLKLPHARTHSSD